MTPDRSQPDATRPPAASDTLLARVLSDAGRLALVRRLAATPTGLPLAALRTETADHAQFDAHLRLLEDAGAIERSGQSGVVALAASPLGRTLAGMFAPPEVRPPAAPLATLELDAVLNQIAAGVALYDAAGNLVRLNPSGERITRRRRRPGESGPERIERFGLRHPDGRPMSEEESPSGRARRGESFAYLECLIDGMHGPETYIVVSGGPLRDEHGRTRGGVIVFTDLTEQRRLQQEEARQRALVEAIIEWAPVGIALYDASDAFRCVRHNGAFLQLVGPEYRAHGSIVGVPLDDLFDDESRARVRAIYEQVRASATPFTLDEFPAVLMPDPEPRWYRWSLIPLRDGAGAVTALLNCAIEITELVRTREQERRQAATLQAIIAAMPEAVAVADRDGRFVLTNAAAERLWGRAAPEDGQVTTYAEVFPCYSLDGRLLNNEELPLPRALAGQTIIGQELRYIQPDGTEIDLLCSAAPVYAHGEEDRFGGVVIFQDITTMKALERQRDEFLGVAAHELRTPLATVIGTVQMLLRLYARDATVERGVMVRGLERMHAQARRLNKLISDLLDASRYHGGLLPFPLEPVDFAAIVREAVEAQQIVLQRRELTVRVPEEPVMVLGDAMRLHQVLENLLTNAAKYSAEGTPIAIRLEVTEQHAHLAVRDFGVGIAPESLGGLFERFYRVPGVEVQAGSGIGLGIGLYITRALIERHHGAIWADSTPGVGSTFHVELPLAPATPPRPA